MTNALTTYAETMGGAVGYCTKCGCPTLSRPGFPRRYHHVDRNAEFRASHHRYNWHLPEAISRNPVVAFIRRVAYTVASWWRIPTFKLKLRRISRWPDG